MRTIRQGNYIYELDNTEYRKDGSVSHEYYLVRGLKHIEELGCSVWVSNEHFEDYEQSIRLTYYPKEEFILDVYKDVKEIDSIPQVVEDVADHEIQQQLVEDIADVVLQIQKGLNNKDYLEMSDLVVDIIDYIELGIKEEKYKVKEI